MANKNGGWKAIAEMLAFFTLAIVVIVGILDACGITWSVFVIAKSIVYLFIVILVAIMAYNFTVGKTKGWRIAYWIFVIAAAIMALLPTIIRLIQDSGK